MKLENLDLSGDMTYLDVREPLEFMFGHVAGAINIPLNSLSGKLDEIRKMNQPIVAYCRSGNRSGQAVAFLKSQGIQQIYNGINKARIKLLKQKVA